MNYKEKKFIISIQKEIKEKGKEMIDYGNSREKSFGCGMIESLRIIEIRYKELIANK